MISGSPATSIAYLLLWVVVAATEVVWREGLALSCAALRRKKLSVTPLLCRTGGAAAADWV
jgi:hypothetical protein